MWACGKGNALGQKACDNLRIKDSVLKEKFVECYNEFVENRYETDNVQDLQNEHNKLVDNVKQLNLLKTQRLISVSDYFVEQQKLDEQISILSKKIDSQTLRFKSDEYDKIENFSKDKLDKFIKSVTIKDYVVTFIFYNDVRVSRKYAKEICGHKKGWSKKGRQ